MTCDSRHSHAYTQIYRREDNFWRVMLKSVSGSEINWYLSHFFAVQFYMKVWPVFLLCLPLFFLSLHHTAAERFYCAIMPVKIRDISFTINLWSKLLASHINGPRRHHWRLCVYWYWIFFICKLNISWKSCLLLLTRMVKFSSDCLTKCVRILTSCRCYLPWFKW